MEVFKCIEGCGLCCRLSPITVFPHEVIILEKLAKEFDIDLKFRVGYRFIDLKHGIRIAISYIMELIDGICPFLDEKTMKCKIHSIYKPLTCRSFPYVPKVIRYILDHEHKYLDFDLEIAISTACPVIKKFPEILINRLCYDAKFAAKYFPNEYKACIESIKIRKLYLTTLSTLWRLNVIELTEDSGIYPYPVVNAYLFIRQFFPVFTIDKIIGSKLDFL